MASSVKEFAIQCPVCGAGIKITGWLELERGPSGDRYAAATIRTDSTALTEHIATHEPHDPHR